MAHQIFGGRFAGHRKPAWHGLGIVFEEVLSSATDAFRLGRLDFGIRKRMLYLLDPETGAPLPTQHFALWREQTDDAEAAILGVVGDEYKHIDNMDLAAKLDPIAQVWPVETVGALGKGETVWALFRIGDTKVAGEDFREGMLISDTRDGTTALTISYVAERVVCANTLRVAMRGASMTQRIGHGASHEEDVDFWLEIIPAMKQVRIETLQSFEALAGARISIDEAGQIFKAAWPAPVMPQKAMVADSLAGELFNLPISQQLKVFQAQVSHERRVKRREELLGATAELYSRFNEEQPVLAKTAWAALNAVTEICDHGNGRDKDEARARSTLFGEYHQAKQRAYEQALTFV